MQNFLDREIPRLLHLGVIERSDSPYNCALSIAKKSNGDLRLTVNMMPVNEQIVLTQYPATFMESVFRLGAQHAYITILDMSDAYW